MRGFLVKISTAAAIAAAMTIVVEQPPGVVDDRALVNAFKNGDEWLTCGRDYAETHFSPLQPINTTNVSRVGLAWSRETESPSGAGIEATRLSRMVSSAEAVRPRRNRPDSKHQNLGKRR
jgi:glucose dehydrogenase